MYGPARSALVLQRPSPYGAGQAQNEAGKPNGEGAAAPSSNLYVTGLPSPELDQASLHLLFEQFGLCVARSKTIPDTRGSGSSAALVQLASTEEAERAIAELHGQTLAGQAQALSLVFASSRPGSDRKPGGAAGAPLMVKYVGSDNLPSDNLYIAGLPSPQADPTALEELFTGLGLAVVRSRIIPDTRGSGSSAAMVQLASQEEAASALATLNGQVVQGLAPAAAMAAPVLAAAAAVSGSISTPMIPQGQGRPLLELAAQDPGRGAGSLPAPSSTNLYLTGLPSPEVEQASLNAMFEQLGLSVVRSRVIPDTKGYGTSAAMVQVASHEQAERAIAELNGQLLSGCDQPLSVAHARDGSALGLAAAGDRGAASIIAGFIGQGAIAPVAPVAAPVAPITPMAPIMMAPVVPVASIAPIAAAKPTPPLMVKYVGAENTPSDNLYISGLPSPQADADALHELFTGLGCTIVRFRIIPDTRGSGSSAAMIQLASQEEAATALATLNGQVVHGLQSGTLGTLQATTPAVGSAAPAARSVPLLTRSTPPVRSAAGPPLLVKFAGGDGSTASDNLYISGLPSPQVDPTVLNKLFVSLGLSIVRSKIIPDTRRIGSSAAMVQLASQEEAATAIASLNGEVFSALDIAGLQQEAGGDAFDTSLLALGYVGGPNRPSDTLRVTGLPSQVPGPEVVKQAFVDLGLNVTQVRIVPDPHGAAGASSAVVKLGSQEEATVAIMAFMGSDFDAPGTGGQSAPKPLLVGPQAPLKPDMALLPPLDLEALRVKYVGSSGMPSDNLYISGLPAPQVDQAQLLGLFEDLGLTVVRSKIIADTQGRGSSAAMVQLASQEQAAIALSTLSRVA